MCGIFSKQIERSKCVSGGVGHSVQCLGCLGDAKRVKGQIIKKEERNRKEKKKQEEIENNESGKKHYDELRKEEKKR